MLEHERINAVKLLQLLSYLDPFLTLCVRNISVYCVIFEDYALKVAVRGGATSWKVTGSISDGVIGIFHLHNPSTCTMALGLAHPLTEMSTRHIYWGVKAAGA